jgi:hypothetical protein
MPNGFFWSRGANLWRVEFAQDNTGVALKEATMAPKQAATTFSLPTKQARFTAGVEPD